ncbi:bola-like protein [Gautieria morchelliformis]|nr:bola-like protein [Gautieria morchelliformis]
MSALFRRLGNRVSVVTRAYSQGRASAQPPPNPPRTVGEDNIYNKLQAKFSPSQLLVQDVSGGCGDFYAITIASGAFHGLSVLKQHRLVQDELKQEIGSIHGLQIKTIPT